MRVIDYGRLLLLAALWGASFLFMRITTPAFGALNSAFLRVLFAAIALGLLPVSYTHLTLPTIYSV